MHIYICTLCICMWRSWCAIILIFVGVQWLPDLSAAACWWEDVWIEGPNVNICIYTYAQILYIQILYIHIYKYVYTYTHTHIHHMLPAWNAVRGAWRYIPIYIKMWWNIKYWFIYPTSINCIGDYIYIYIDYIALPSIVPFWAE